MSRKRVLSDRRLTSREAVSRHRAQLAAAGDVRCEITLSRQTLRTVDREAVASGRSRTKELRSLVEEGLAKRSSRRHGRSD